MATVRPIIHGLEAQERLGRDVMSIMVSPMVRDIVRQQDLLRAATQHITMVSRMARAQGRFFNVPVTLNLSEAAFHAVDDVLQAEDASADAAGLVEELDERFGWTSRYRQALSDPELTPEERRDRVRSMALALWLYLVGLQYPQVANAIQLADALVGFWLMLQITDTKR